MRGATQPEKNMPRFVILKHETPLGSLRGTHWDLMLEADGVLRTWTLAAEPVGGKTMVAERLADHRVAYLDYEGPIAGDRGTVTRCDAGTMEWGEVTDECVVATLQGAIVRGEVRLWRESSADNRWLVSFTAETVRGGH